MAFQHADCIISDIRDKMTTRLHQADRDVAADKSVALDAVNQCAATSAAVSAAEHSYYHTKACATLKKNAKQLDIQQRSFDVDVKNLRSASKRNTQKNEVVIGKQATMIRHLQTKVASAELSVELMWGQLEKEHKDAMSDLMVASRSKIRDIMYDHVIFLAEEKKKIQLQLITEHQRQNSLYTEVLDYRQDARVARKAGTISIFLSSQRLKRMKEWRLKSIQSASINELVDRQRSIDVMEQRLQEYSAIINEKQIPFSL